MSGCATVPHEQAGLPAAIVKPAALPQAQIAGTAAFTWPVAGTVASYFGNPVYGAKNKGIDINCAEGAPVTASKSGKVVFCQDRVKGLGKVIIIDHLDGFSTVYSGNSENMVKAGDYIKQGQVIAKAGSGGRGASTRVHFEIRKRHTPQNPLDYLN
ncbi:MAG: M23 family metallopeptidase [Candidatus Omnitrophica bacterium]|nr:M23 family metallopeptidase [Candidatus Omnitrophota bacterium]